MGIGWEKYLKLGIVHFMAYPETIKGEGPILETLTEIAKDDDFEVVELTWIRDAKVRKRVQDLLASANLEVAYGAQPRLLIKKLNLNDFNEEGRLMAVKEVKDSLDEARSLGAKGVAILSGKDPGVERRNEAKIKLIESLKESADYAAEKGMNVILEQFDRVPYGKNCLVGPTIEAVETIRKTARSNLGLMIDLSHLPLLEETPKEVLAMAKDYLHHIHIGNCVKKFPEHPAYGDEHPRFGLLEGENGVKELKEFLGELFKVGYLKEEKRDRPIVSFEVKPMKDELSGVIIADAKRTFHQAWSEIDKL